tara:strand:- start:90 stop:383 length:294 start_codon:yes stop_codon:yes gene_type:complete
MTTRSTQVEYATLRIPFECAVLNDEAFNNIKGKLEGGEKYMKSYLTTCPHYDKKDCNCPFNLNFLRDGNVIRIKNGKSIPVLSATTAIGISNIYKEK